MFSKLQAQTRPDLGGHVIDSERAGSANEELRSVLEELQLQAGGSFGFILSTVGAEPVMAACGTLPASSEVGGMIDIVQQHLAGLPDSGGANNAPAWIDGPDASSGKLLCLPVAAEPARRVVAVIGFAPEIENALREAAGEAARRILPVLRPFVRLWDRMHAERGLLTGLNDALDQSDIPVVVLNADARVQFVNRSARALLSAEDGLRFSFGTVVATSLGDAIRLQVTIEHVIARNRTKVSGGRPNAHLLLLHRGAEKRPIVATIVEAEAPARNPSDAAAILYLVKPEHDLGPFVTSVCRLHKLSPAETRLARLLVGGSTLAEAAKLMRVKEHTARAYLKQIFLKTETNRQTDLVRLMLSSLVPMPDSMVPATVD